MSIIIDSILKAAGRHKMKNHSLLKITIGTALGCLASLALADDPPLQLHIEAPSGNGGVALLSESGWPVIIKMVVNEEDGLGYFIEPDFPQLGTRGLYVFSDEDECFSIIGPTPSKPCDSQPPEYEWPANEVYMKFYAGTDMSGVAEDYTYVEGDSELREKLVDSKGSGGTQLQDWFSDDICVPGTPDSPAPEGGAPGCANVGPESGGEMLDGYGIGTDDDLPGLVLISDMGVGKVFEEPDFELPEKRGVRNLAGLVTSVAYELSNVHKENSKPKGRKGAPDVTLTYQNTFWAHANFPRHVIRPIVQYDMCVGEIPPDLEPPEAGCVGDELWRIDGGPIEKVKDTLGHNVGRVDFATVGLMNLLSYEITAFMVSGTAPDKLFDEDGDGDVDSADATLAGFTVISNEDHVEFLLLSQSGCHGGGGNGLYEDLDGNGIAAPDALVCPAGPGDIDRPPR
jgi:hypothetical protein